MGTIMDDNEYHTRELGRLKVSEVYRLQVRADDHDATRWLNITPAQLAHIAAFLTGEQAPVYALQRETVDGLYAFRSEHYRNAYAALLEGYEVGEATPLTINVMDDAQAVAFLAAESESLATDVEQADGVDWAEVARVDAEMWGEQR